MKLIRIARGYVIAVAIAAAAGVAAGIAMHIALWTPDPNPDTKYYNLIFSGHGTWLVSALGTPAIAGACGYLLVPALIDARRERAVMLGWMGLATWIGALIVAAFIVLAPDDWALQPDWRLMVVRALFATSGGITAIHLASVIGFNRRRRHATPLPVALAGAKSAASSSVLSAASSSVAAFARGFTIETSCAYGLVAATAAAAIAEVPGPALAFEIAIIAATIVVTAALARGAAHRPPAGLVIAGFVGMVWWALSGGGPGFFVIVVVLVWLSVGRDWSRPAAIYACLGMIPALIAATGTGAVSPDTHLGDTYFVTGHAHFVFAAVGFAVLAVLSPRTKLASAAAVIVCVCLIIHAGAMLPLGTAGMPRRYASYDPVFTNGFRYTAIAAVGAAAGLVLAVVAMISSPPWLERSSSS